MFEAVGLMVSRLMRVRYGPVHLSPRLKRGQCRDLEPGEVQELFKLLPPELKSSVSEGPGVYSDIDDGLDVDVNRIDLAEK
jgi:23S rRNA pseudouridine2605 synthase